MPSWYTNMYKKAASMGGAQTYMPANQMKKSTTAVQKLQGVIGNNPGQTPAPGASLPKAYNQLAATQNDVYTPAIKPTTKLAANTAVNTAAPVNGADAVGVYTPGTYTAGAAPTYNYTPAQRATLEEMMTRASGMLKGQWDSENVGYDNQLASIKTSLQNIISGYNAQYQNDEATAQKNLQKDLKTNTESANARGMFWSTIPDIQATELEKNNQDNLTQLKNIINSNIGQATNTAQTNEAGVLNMKAALAGKYGSAAQQLAQQMYDSDNATKDAADNRALTKYQIDTTNYNEAENRNSSLFTNNENRKADLYNSEKNRQSTEGIASADRMSKEEQAGLDRLESRYATDKNSLTQIEIQKMADLRAKADRLSTEKMNSANNKASAADTDKKIAADKSISSANNATQIATAKISAGASRYASDASAGIKADAKLTPAQMEDKEAWRSSTISQFATNVDTTILGGLKKPSSNSDWQAWQDAYDGIQATMANGSIRAEFQPDVKKAFGMSNFYKKYNAYKAEWGGKSANSNGGGSALSALRTSVTVPKAGTTKYDKAKTLPKGTAKKDLGAFKKDVGNMLNSLVTTPGTKPAKRSIVDELKKLAGNKTTAKKTSKK